MLGYLTHTRMTIVLRMILGWLIVAAGIAARPLGYGPWLFMVAPFIAKILRYTLKLSIPGISEMGRPTALLLLSLLILFIACVVASSFFFYGSPTMRVISWCTSGALLVYLLY